MSPGVRPGAAARSPFALLVLLAPLSFAVATSATASTLAAYGSYVGEDHSHEDHHSEGLREINLSQANLPATNFKSANLTSALFVDATAVDAVFTSALLSGANFSGADLTRADLSKANLKNTNFASAVLTDASLAGSDIDGSDLRGAYLLGTDLSGVKNGDLANFSGAYFDADTQLDPAIDDSEMYYVVGVCPPNASQYWIDSDRDGHGDHCSGATPLPEPGAAALFAGSALLAAPARRRG
jgi:uncharacterized protein YjbI with pentapeptide repeats